MSICCFLICFFTYWSLCWFLDWYISLFEGVFKTVGFLLRFETIISLQLTIKLMRPNSFHFAASLFAFLPTGRFVGFLIDTFVCLKACSKLIFSFVWGHNIVVINNKDHETEQFPFCCVFIGIFTHCSVCWFLGWYFSLFEGVFKTVGVLHCFETIISLQLTIKHIKPSSFHFAASFFCFFPTGQFVVSWLIHLFVYTHWNTAKYSLK